MTEIPNTNIEIEAFGSPSWIELNRQNLIHNITNIKEVAGRLNVYAVLKANAYGHGAVEIARVLQDNGISSAAVSSAREAAQLRQAGINLNLLIFDPVPSYDIAKTLSLGDTSLTVSDGYMIPLIENEAKKMGIQAPVQVFVDTGMHREGIPIGLADEEESILANSGFNLMTATEAIKHIHQSSDLKLDGIYTHLATPTSEDTTFPFLQLERFDRLLNEVETQNIPLPPNIHIAEGAALMRFPQMHREDPKRRITAVRIGNLIYGLPPGGKDFPYMTYEPKRVFKSLKSNLFSIADVPQGEGVGYSLETSDQPTRKGVIAIGSTDGFRPSYSLTGQSYVLIRGQRIPIYGRENMCITSVKLPLDQEFAFGDEVVLIGQQGKESINLEEAAQMSGLKSIYRFLVQLNGFRLQRRFID